jgi:hypothetical protein
MSLTKPKNIHFFRRFSLIGKTLDTFTPNRWSSVFLVLTPGIIFVTLATVRLDAQGLYYDELHQATGAFGYLGSSPAPFVVLTVGDILPPLPLVARLKSIPLLTMHYSGATKQAVYGLYLLLVEPKFGVVSWRLTGILVVASALVGFVLLVHRSLSTLSLVALLGFFLTDVTVILCTRHDWGPVAMALALRLVFIGLWLRVDRIGQPSFFTAFALGALVGVSVYDKLSSVVLIVPLARTVLINNRAANVTASTGPPVWRIHWSPASHCSQRLVFDETR